MTILIPSYEPDERLLTLIHNLKSEAEGASILIVDDGSGEQYKPIFDSAAEAGCTVIRHPVNQGKGCALKTGFDYVRQHGCTDGVICADSDGQHLPEDILKITDAVRKNRNHIVLGSRQFTGKVPLRSRFGNSATRMVYALATGKPIQDTQTGLRGYSSEMLDWLCKVPGERFEYEMNMLLEAPKAGYDFVEVPIETVYLENNKSSHFRPLADSAKIYFPFLKFVTSSGFSAVVDFVLLFLLQWMTGSLLASVIGARVISSIFNFTMNRRYVFNDGQGISVQKSLPRYFSLVVIILIANYALLYLFHESIGIPLFIAKLMTEVFLFAFSYLVQRKFVY